MFLRNIIKKHSRFNNFQVESVVLAKMYESPFHEFLYILPQLIDCYWRLIYIRKYQITINNNSYTRNITIILKKIQI